VAKHLRVFCHVGFFCALIDGVKLAGGLRGRGAMVGSSQKGKSNTCMTTESECEYRGETRAITFNCLKEKADG